MNKTERSQQRARNLCNTFEMNAVAAIPVQITGIFAFGTPERQVSYDRLMPNQPAFCVEALICGQPANCAFYATQHLYRELITQGIDTSKVEVSPMPYRDLKQSWQMMDTNHSSRTYKQEMEGYPCYFFYYSDAETVNRFHDQGHSHGL